jgi:hypothetical protein
MASLLIGRGAEADVQLTDPSTSARHARLHVEEGAVAIEDLASRNGTQVRGQTIPADERVALAPGEAAMVGNAVRSSSTRARPASGVVRSLTATSSRSSPPVRSPLFRGPLRGTWCHVANRGSNQTTRAWRSTTAARSLRRRTAFMVAATASPSTAITPGTNVRDVIAGSTWTRIASGSGWIFASDGNALNATTLQPLGKYVDRYIGVYGVAPVPDPDGKNVWFLSYVDTGMALLAFDRTTFQLLRTISLGPLSASNPSALVRWSPTSFAFRSYENLYLIKLPS